MTWQSSIEWFLSFWSLSSVWVFIPTISNQSNIRKKRKDEKTKPQKPASKTEDTKTEQAANVISPPAKGKRMDVQGPECSSKINQQKEFLSINKLAEKKVAAEKEKMKMRKEEKIQRQLLYKKMSMSIYETPADQQTQLVQ